MPLTGLANAAIDRIAGGPASFAAGLARYGENDLLCYRAESPPDLVARQAASWDPLLDWARRRYDVHFEVTTGIIHRSEEHTSELQSLMRISYAVFCLKKKHKNYRKNYNDN